MSKIKPIELTELIGRPPPPIRKRPTTSFIIGLIIAFPLGYWAAPTTEEIQRKHALKLRNAVYEQCRKTFVALFPEKQLQHITETMGACINLSDLAMEEFYQPVSRVRK